MAKKIGKKILTLMLSLTITAGMAGCSSSKGDSSHLTKDTNPDKGLPIIGENVKFDPNKLVNDGEPIEIEFWLWDNNEMFKAMVSEYENIYPNVDIKPVVQPWDDYWTKLPLSLNGKNGPAVFNMHNSQHDNLINYMAPYDISLDELRKDFIGVDGHVIDNNVHYIDYGMMTGSVYYNKALWKEAGLTEKDIPKTWDQFIEVSKKLTKYDESGNVTQAGFNFNGDYYSLITALNYQSGELLFKDDKTTANIENETTIKNTKFLTDLYDKYKVGSKDFGLKSDESFGQGKSAMVSKWGWYNNTIKEKYPDIEYGVFQIPTFSEELPLAIDRYNGESTIGINKNADKDEQAVAQDFVRFFIANDDLIKNFCLNYSVFPSKNSLAKDPEILEHQVLSQLAPNIEHYIWPGSFPSIIEDSLKIAGQEIIYNKVAPKDAIKKAQASMESEMKNSDFESVEDLYKFISEKK